MNIRILIERDGHRDWVDVDDHGPTRIEGVRRIRYYRPDWLHREGVWWSLVHVASGRAINQQPLSSTDVDRLVDALLESPVEWDRIDPVAVWPGRGTFIGRLNPEAEQIAVGKVTTHG